MKLIDVEKLKEIAEVEFDGIAANAEVVDLNELRIFLKEGSFIDVESGARTCNPTLDVPYSY